MGKGSKAMKERAAARQLIMERKKQTCHWCHRCPQGEESFKLCVGCKSVHYCSSDCQLIDWKGGDHHSRCSGKPAAC